MKIQDIGMTPLLTVGLFALAGRSFADTYARPAGIQIANYTFDITLNDANNELKVADTVDIRFLAAGGGGHRLDSCPVCFPERPAPTAQRVPHPPRAPPDRGGGAR